MKEDAAIPNLRSAKLNVIIEIGSQPLKVETFLGLLIGSIALHEMSLKKRIFYVGN